jgi:hypothetical protein
MASAPQLQTSMHLHSQRFAALASPPPAQPLTQHKEVTPTPRHLPLPSPKTRMMTSWSLFAWQGHATSSTPVLPLVLPLTPPFSAPFSPHHLPSRPGPPCRPTSHHAHPCHPAHQHPHPGPHLSRLCPREPTPMCTSTGGGMWTPTLTG